MRVIAILSFALLWLSCGDRKAEPWIPVFEETHFVYLDNVVNRALEKIEAIETDVARGEMMRARQDLLRTKQVLLSLKDYYIPMTNVRQLIYDADRLFYLKKGDETKAKLEAARDIVVEIGKTASHLALVKPLHEVVLLIDDALLALEENVEDVPTVLKSLGKKVNLMLLKGELILSEEEFEK